MANAALGEGVSGFDLAEEAGLLLSAAKHAEGQAAKTLVVLGPMRATLVALVKDAALAPHQTRAAVCIQSIKGVAKVTLDGGNVRVAQGSLFALAPSIRHGIAAEEDCAILVTAVHPQPLPTL